MSEEVGRVKSSVYENVFINKYKPDIDIFDVLSPILNENMLIFLFSPKELDRKEIEHVIKYAKFYQYGPYLNKELIEWVCQHGYIVGHFLDDYYIASLDLEKQVVVCYVQKI
ncbi:hypothetical protein [Bacillus pseudomycoides]|uniref:hypothetical protein n=1 Tax=Bacillus pseudomycoides TaxID=64104 RepID=UPI001FB38074|nr:hypothetical protein [Bacillus pseudomycoides]